MLCEVCGKREASIRITEKVGDVQRVRHLCEECWRADKTAGGPGRAPEAGWTSCPACGQAVVAGEAICPNCLADLPDGSFDLAGYRRQISGARIEAIPGIRALGALLSLIGIGLLAFMMVSQRGFIEEEQFIFSWRQTLIAAELAILGVVVLAAGVGLWSLRRWGHWLCFWGTTFLMMTCIWQMMVRLQQGILAPGAGVDFSGWFFVLPVGFVLAVLVVGYLSRAEIRQRFWK